MTPGLVFKAGKNGLLANSQHVQMLNLNCKRVFQTVFAAGFQGFTSGGENVIQISWQYLFAITQAKDNNNGLLSLPISNYNNSSSQTILIQKWIIR